MRAGLREHTGPDLRNVGSDSDHDIFEEKLLPSWTIASSSSKSPAFVFSIYCVILTALSLYLPTTFFALYTLPYALGSYSTSVRGRLGHLFQATFFIQATVSLSRPH